MDNLPRAFARPAFRIAGEPSQLRKIWQTIAIAVAEWNSASHNPDEKNGEAAK